MAARKTTQAKPATDAAASGTGQDDFDALPVGSVWSFPATDRTPITRPDGAVVDVDPNPDGQILHVLNVPGDYSAPGHSIVCR